MESLRVGILGCGGHAGAHARRYRTMPTVRVAALCDASPAAMESLVNRRLDGYAPAPTHYTDPAQMYAEQELDAVSILTPHSFHAEHIIQALEAGCHVLVEKPMVTSIADAERVSHAARAVGRHLLVCYNPPFEAAVSLLRQIVSDRRFGALRGVSAYLAQNWLTVTAGSWRQQLAIAGGGQSEDSGAHLLAGLCWAVGAEPVQVSALMERRGTEVDIDSAVLIRFANGCLASVGIGGDSLMDGSFTAFVFERGRVELDLWRGEWIRVYDGDQLVAEPELPPAPGDPNTHFIQVVRGEAPPLISLDDALRQARLTDAIRRSAATGMTVEVAVNEAAAAS